MYNAVMPKRSRKNKRLDLNRLASYIVNKSTSEDLLNRAVKEGKNPAAVYLGRLGGLKGGKARAVKLSVEKRIEIAKKAAEARWDNNKK
jgi:hypothetical protein